MSTATAGYEYHPFGLPMGSVRGFMSVLICSFFWIVLLLPDAQAVKPPLAHFFLLTLVFLAFASHPGRSSDEPTPLLPWLMRVIFVGGSAAVIGYVAWAHPDRLNVRLTPDKEEITQWPIQLATLAGGFGVGLFMRFVLGRNGPPFQTGRAWVGVIAMLMLVTETVIQFLVLPNTARQDPNSLQVWEGIVTAFVACYFGMRA
jgi:hypothetical protein